MSEKLEFKEIAVPESEYLTRLEQQLKNLPAEQCVILCLCQKIGDLSDPLEKTPLFAFGSNNVPMKAIMAHAEQIESVNWMLPALKVKFYLMTAPEHELTSHLELLEKDNVDPPKLATLLRKFKEACALAQQAAALSEKAAHA